MTKTPKPKSLKHAPKPLGPKSWWGRTCRRSYYNVCERHNETAQDDRKRRPARGAKRKTGIQRRAKG